MGTPLSRAEIKVGRFFTEDDHAREIGRSITRRLVNTKRAVGVVEVTARLRHNQGPGRHIKLRENLPRNRSTIRVGTSIYFSELLVYFPLFRNGIILPGADEKFNAPDYKRKEDVHPSPPHLRRVIEDYEIPSSEAQGDRSIAEDTYEGGVNKQ